MEKPNYNKNIKELKLSIQVRLDGLSFLILDARSREVVWYEKTSFQGEFTPPKVLQKLEDHFQKEAELKSDFTEVVLLFSNDLYSLVPEDFFIEEEASNFLKFNTRILKTDVLAHDHIAGHKMVNVYIPYTNITNYIFDKFGEFEFKHSISVFIEAVLNFDSGENTIAYLHAFSNYYHLVIVKEGKLLYSNSFIFETREDFIYYLLFSFEQLKMDPLKVPLKISGEINSESENYKIVYNYIKNVEFLLPEIDLSSEDYNTPEFKREAFILLKSLI